MAMHLSDLKRKPVPELMDMAREMGLDNVGRSRKQEVIAAIMRKQHATMRRRVQLKVEAIEDSETILIRKNGEKPRYRSLCKNQGTEQGSR